MKKSGGPAALAKVRQTEQQTEHTHTQSQTEAGRNVKPRGHTCHTSHLSHAQSGRSRMFLWRLPEAVCLLSACVCAALAYEDVLEINYDNNYENEITQEEATQSEC